jgi:hypothetical protein
MTERENGPTGTSAGQAGGGATAYGAGPDTGTAAGTGTTADTAPDYSTRPAGFRRPDAVAALLLVLAGVAAGISLLLDWLSDRDDSGLALVRRGIQEFGDLGSSGFWQPLAVVAGGAVLFLLGLLMFVPARTHRFLGVLALLVSLLAAAGVLVPLAQDGWSFGGFAAGFWFAIAVAVLGLLGSLKALLSGPKYA